MSLSNHDRLDRVLHTEEYIDMPCGSLGYVLNEVARSSPEWDENTRMKERDETGGFKMERKYCGPDCPTLKAHILAEARGETGAV